MLCAALVFTVAGCSGNSGNTTPANTTPPSSPGAGDSPFVAPNVEISRGLPEVKIDGATGSLPLSSAAVYGWNAMIALNWPASTAANARGVPDPVIDFGQPGTPAWATMRSKVEVFPGNADETHAPHGVVLDASGKPANGPDFGYGDPPQYVYKTGPLQPCTGQPPVTTAAFIVLDETTQINNNQTFAGAAPAVDPRGFNTAPQLIRYAVKMNKPIFSRAMGGQYWYQKAGSPLVQARTNYEQALATGTQANPTPPYVNYAPTELTPDVDDLAGIEIKSAWRPLSPTELRSGRFLTATVRYYEQPQGTTSCYREDTWGLVGMHVISFPLAAPWVIWTTFEQVDNILTADGRPTEDADGNVLVNYGGPATTPALSSDPSVPNPTVTAKGDYCFSPGSRLYFRENPKYGTLPSGGNICVNARWSQPDRTFVDTNRKAHAAIAAYLGKNKGASPLMHYRLVGAQGVPVDYDNRNLGFFSTEASYQSANMTIETDYSLANFTGILVNGVPSNVQVKQGKQETYYNTRLLPFQTSRLGFKPMRMGGCAGCHGFGASLGGDFSFSLGNNVTTPEATNAFGLRTANLERIYFPPPSR